MKYVAHGHRTIASVLVEDAEAKLTADGVPLVDPSSDTTAELRLLFSDENTDQAITPEEHADCPGHAAYVHAQWSAAHVRWVCTDYAAHGHILRGSASKEETRDAEFLAGERKRTRENNDLWEDQEVARRKWLEKLFSKWRTGKLCIEHPKKPGEDLLVNPPAQVQHWLIRATVQASNNLVEAQPLHGYACRLLGLKQTAGSEHPIVAQPQKKNVGDAQAQIIRLAQVLGAGEKYFDISYTRRSADHTWRQQNADTRFHFGLLKFIGYPAAHIERLVLDPSLDNAKWPHLASRNASADTAE